MRRTKGRVYQRGGAWWIDYQVNGERFRHSLKDRNGQPVTSAEVARNELDRLTRPLTARDEQVRRQLAADALRTSKEVAQAADHAARPLHRIADAWARAPYVRSRRGDTERELSASTIVDNEILWSKFSKWAAAAGVVNMEDATPEHAAAYRESLIAEQLSGHRVNLSTIVARTMFDLAGVEPNPFAGIKRRSNVAKSRRELTPDELVKVCQSAKGDLRILLALGLYTGMRLGDCCTLPWESIALDLSTITRLPRKTAYKGQELVIPIHPALRVILAELPRGQGPILPVIAARYLHRNSLVTQMVRRHFKAQGIATAAVVAGRKRHACVAGFHSLRHCFVSMQARAGVPEHVVRALVGHASPMVHQIYQHANGDDKTRAIAALPALGAVAEPERQQLTELLPRLAIATIREFLTRAQTEVKA